MIVELIQAVDVLRVVLFLRAAVVEVPLFLLLFQLFDSSAGAQRNADEVEDVCEKSMFDLAIHGRA